MSVQIIQAVSDWPSAVWGFLGAILGALTSFFGIWLTHHLKVAQQRRDDDARKVLLKQMLDNSTDEWRKMETLSRVIGASKEDTARLLIQLGARGSESENDVWALLSKKPLR